MSLDKSRIPKIGNSSRKFIPEEQRKKMTDPVRGVCDIRPECEKCNLCGIRNFSCEPSELVILRDWRRYLNDGTKREG